MSPYLTRRNAKRIERKAKAKLTAATRAVTAAAQMMSDAAGTMTTANDLMTRGTPASGDEAAWANALNDLSAGAAKLRQGGIIP